MYVQGQPSLQIEFQENWDYRGTLSQISPQKKTKKKKKKQWCAQAMQLKVEDRHMHLKSEDRPCSTNMKIGCAAKGEDRLHISKVKLGHAAQK